MMCRTTEVVEKESNRDGKQAQKLVALKERNSQPANKGAVAEEPAETGTFKEGHLKFEKKENNIHLQRSQNEETSTPRY